MAHSEATKKKISKACRESETFQESHRRSRPAEERAAISASRRVDKETDPDLWQAVYEKALKRILLRMRNEAKTSEIEEQERELIEAAAEA